jgi:hypothetical protein
MEMRGIGVLFVLASCLGLVPGSAGAMDAKELSMDAQYVVGSMRTPDIAAACAEGPSGVVKLIKQTIFDLNKARCCVAGNVGAEIGTYMKESGCRNAKRGSK